MLVPGVIIVCHPRYSFCVSAFLPALVILFSIASAAAVPVRFETIAREADMARVSDHVADAIRLYREGTNLRPSWSDGWWYLGSLLYDQDRFSEADVAFRHLLASPSHRGAALAFRGLCEYETGKYDQSLAHFRAWAGAGWAGTRELRNVAVFHFALLLTRDGRFVESLYLLATEAQLSGERPELVEAMGLASLRMRNLPENYASDRREAIWLAGKAALYAAQTPKDFDRADEFAARLVARYPFEPEVHYFRGTLYGFEGQKPEAEREYREQLKVSPNHVPSLIALAGLEMEKAEVSAASNFARQAAAADPSNAEAHHLLGRAYLADDDWPPAASELETAKRLAPANPEVRSHLAMVYSKLGRTREAKAESAAFLVLKKKEEVMAPPKEKLREVQGKTH
jgi:tetratricopeptide (TPR) repeat protein